MKKQILAILGIALVMIASAFAITVNYLSNSTTVTTKIESPIAAALSVDGTTYGATADLGTVYGGSTVDLFIRTVNQANGEITGAKLTISFVGLECANLGTNIGTCSNVNGHAVVEVLNQYTPNEAKDQTLSLTLVPNVEPATYSASIQVMYG